jgi:hypothetical protein
MTVKLKLKLKPKLISGGQVYVPHAWISKPEEYKMLLRRELSHGTRLLSRRHHCHWIHFA